MNHKNQFGENLLADDLTWREYDVLILLADRLTNKEIASKLHLAESTVKDYVGRILDKLYVKNRRQAVERARELGLLDAAKKSTDRKRYRLPSPPTPFVGRREELVQIKQDLSSTNLLTLSGPGGIGKTRLALQAASELVADFEDGCCFVALAPIRSSDQIVPRIAEALNLPLATHQDPLRQLLRFLKDKKILIVTNNFEHVLEGVNIVNEILAASPGVKILATSREKLNLTRETNISIGGMKHMVQLGFKDISQNDAASLFIQRAKKVSPEFDPTPEELSQIENICWAVQGMPLAIELAAAWLHVLQVEEIAEELTRGLDILTTETRDIPERHRSIRSVFDHSWSLLGTSEQEIVKRLSVFRGGFTRSAAQKVSSATLNQLASLANKSFLSHDPDSGRYGIHEMLRQCAQELLEENPEEYLLAQQLHAEYFAAFMQERWGGLRSKHQNQLLIEVEEDIENIRIGWQFAVEQKDPDQIWQFIYSLWFFHFIRWWNQQGMNLFGNAVDALAGDHREEIAAARALSMAFQSFFMGWVGYPDRAYRLADQCVNLLEKLPYPDALALAYRSLNLSLYFLNRYSEFSESVKREMEVASTVPDQWFLNYSLFAVGMGALIIGNYEEAKRVAQANLQTYEEIGDLAGSTMPLIVLGHDALVHEDYSDAEMHYLKCWNRSREVGFPYSMQTSSKYLGKVYLALGDISNAYFYLREGLKISNDIGFVRDIVNLFYEFARLRAVEKNFEGAIELLGLVIQHPASQEARWLEGRIRDNAKDLLGELEGKVSPQCFSAALERGRSLDLDTCIAEFIGRKP
jgi:predicted ATPase/DNA-binding CsgD family transcriptional regulator